MMNCDYRESLRESIKNYLEETEERDYTVLYDELWLDDSVTGNGSGSYTMNRERAKHHVLDNEDLLSECISEFCIDMNEHWNDWEYLDVSIRCYLLGEVLQEVLDESEEV